MRMPPPPCSSASGSGVVDSGLSPGDCSCEPRGSCGLGSCGPALFFFLPARVALRSGLGRAKRRAVRTWTAEEAPSGVADSADWSVSSGCGDARRRAAVAGGVRGESPPASHPVPAAASHERHPIGGIPSCNGVPGPAPGPGGGVHGVTASWGDGGRMRVRPADCSNARGLEGSECHMLPAGSAAEVPKAVERERCAGLHTW